MDVTVLQASESTQSRVLSSLQAEPSTSQPLSTRSGKQTGGGSQREDPPDSSRGGAGGAVSGGLTSTTATTTTTAAGRLKSSLGQTQPLSPTIPVPTNAEYDSDADVRARVAEMATVCSCLPVCLCESTHADL